MSDFEESQRGQLAQQVLENPVYLASYGQLTDEITRKWKDSRDKDEREQLHSLLLIVEKARNVLETTMRRGELAEAELTRKRTLMERAGLRRAS